MNYIRSAFSRLTCLLFLALCYIFMQTSCSAQTKGIRLYTEGLKALDEKNASEALLYFSKAKAQGSALIQELADFRYNKLSENKENLSETISSYVAKKNYAASSELLDSILAEQELSQEEYLAYQSAENLSDLGKTYLYYRGNYEINAKVWENAFLNSQNDTNRFMLLFYSARLTQRIGQRKDTEKACKMFELAMEFAQSDENYDSALYYYLQNSLSLSINDALSALEKYGSTINDSSWFSDFFDQFSALLLQNNLWNEYYKTFTIVDKCGDSRTRSQFAYVTGLLLENELLFLDLDCKNFYEKAYTISDGTDFYRVVSARKLKAPVSYKESAFSETLEWDSVKQKEFMQLQDYLFSLGMDFWSFNIWNENKNKIDFSNTLQLSKKFSSRSNKYIQNMTCSIRVAVNAAIRKNYHVDKEHLRMLYPEFFKNEICSTCSEYSLNKNLLFALVRSESFFNPEAVSSAGAVGLTQLMYPTASDVAKKLKAKDFDLRDPAVNIKFGGFYLADLIRRLDGQELMAVCSYNAGITRVRQWISKYGKYGSELFIEMIPYSETREYARKIIGTEFIYTCLE